MSVDLDTYCQELADRAGRARLAMASLTGGDRGQLLRDMGGAIRGASERIVSENAKDLAAGKGLSSALRDRLRGFGPGLLFAVFAGFLLVIPGLAIPAFTQVFLDDILVQGNGDWLRPLVAAMIAA